jgi:hypothetical protein
MRRNLLYCGIIAGPLFIAASLIQAFTRTGFDLARHPLSRLSPVSRQVLRPGRQR